MSKKFIPLPPCKETASRWMETFHEYVEDPPPMAEITMLTLDRYHELLDNPDYYFSEDAVLEVFEFIAKCRHASGKWHGKPFDLMPFQCFIIANLYGFYRHEDQRRLFTRSYFTMARKQGKSELVAVLMVYHLIAEGIGTPEAYVLANKLDQATIAWNAARRIIMQLQEDHPLLCSNLKVYEAINNRHMLNRDNDGIIRPLASKARTLDGLLASMVVVDEFAEAVDDGEVLRTLQSGLVNRDNPMLLIITTRSFNANGICARYEKTMIDILEGRKRDDRTFTMFFTLDKEDDWRDSKLWYKSTPALGRTLTLPVLEAEYERATNEGSTAEVGFKTKNLNIWSKTAKTWMPWPKWLKNPRQKRDLSGELCYMGLDIASNYDLTAVALLFPDMDGQHIATGYFFIPEESAKIRSKRDEVPYLDWGEEENVIFTPGAETDYMFIENYILDLCAEYDVRGIGYDPWNTAGIANRLESHGLPMDKFGQTYGNFNEPIRTLERWISKGVLNCQGNKCIDWQFTNVSTKNNSSGLTMFDKTKTTGRIDFWAALGMAVGLHLDDAEGEVDVEVLVA